MSDTIYSADQIVGKSLYSKREIGIYRNIANYYKNIAPVYVVKQGQHVGLVAGYVQKGSDVWWMFYDSSKIPYYTLHKSGDYDLSALKEQGAKSAAQEAKEAEEKEKDKDKKWYEKLFDSIEKLGMAGLLIGGIAAIIIYSGKGKNNNVY